MGLSSAETADLHSHLKTCEDCARVLDEYRKMRYEFDRAPLVPPPPPELRRAIFSETVEKPTPGRAARWFGFTSLKLGTSTVAAIAVVMIVCAFLLVRGYDRTLTPIISESAPAASQEWPVFQPVEIRFNKAMNHQSVIDNLLIQPRGEKDRLPMSWRGEILIVGASESESAVLLPDTDYLIMILPEAEDAWGNQLGTTWTLAFHTAPIDIAMSSPTPTPVITASVTETAVTEAAEQTAATTPEPTAPTGGDRTTPTAVQTPLPTRSDTEEPGSAQPSGVAPTSSTSETPVAGATPEPTYTPDPTPTQPAATPTQQETVTPAPTPASTPAVETPVPTPVATPSATPTEEPPPTTALQPSPTPTETTTPVPATQSPIPVIGAFGSVYWAESAVQSSLGVPVDAEYSVNAAELGFQHGTMYERFDTGLIYALLSDGTVVEIVDTWSSSDGEGGGPAPEENLWIPKRGLGKAWSEDADLSSAIGYAVSSDEHYFEGRVQEFDNGLMLYSDQGFVYVLHADGTWQIFPDTSGRGNIITPTPSPDPTPAPTEPSGATEVPSEMQDQVDDVTPVVEPDTETEPASETSEPTVESQSGSSENPITP